MNRFVSLILFLILVLGGGLVLGGLTVPGVWYAGLNKPSLNPPTWLFGPVWTVLYVLIAVAGWRVWERDRTGGPMRLWWAQLTLNFLDPVFFAAHQIGLALVHRKYRGGPAVELAISEDAHGFSARDLVKRLQDGEPSVHANHARVREGIVVFGPTCLRPGDPAMVIARVRAELGSPTAAG